MTWRSKSSSLRRKRLGYVVSEASPSLCPNPPPSVAARPQVFHKDLGAAQLIWLALTYQASPWPGWARADRIRLVVSLTSLSTPRCGQFDSSSAPGWEGWTRWSMNGHCCSLDASGTWWCWQLPGQLCLSILLECWGTLTNPLMGLGRGSCDPRVKIMEVTKVKQWEFEGGWMGKRCQRSVVIREESGDIGSSC